MKKILLGFTVLSAMTFASCDGFLEQEPELSQSNELTLSSYDGLNNATAGLYTMLQSASWYDGEYILSSEMRCGNAKKPKFEAGSGRLRGYTDWSNYSETGTSPVWSYAYYTITWANNVINAIPNINIEAERFATQKDLDNIKAEAMFMRAFCYHNLVTTYGQPYTYQPESLGVPVVTVTENGTPARNTVAEVYTQIVADLTEADTLMADNYVRAGVSDPVAAASKPAIQALLSRVYLYMGEWQKAADYATKVINSGKFNLAGAADYKTMFSAAIAPRGGEYIFEVYGDKLNGYWDESGWTHLSYITNFGDNGSADICATMDLINLYEDGDVRLAMYQEHNGEYYCGKYTGKEGVQPRTTNVPIIRVSEMYLNRAEAIINGAKVAGVTAQSDLAALAAKRGCSVAAATPQGVFEERRRELAFEGHIHYDYARCKKSMTRTDFDDLKNKDVAFPSHMWALPIPKREMEANPNMVQNPGY